MANMKVGPGRVDAELDSKLDFCGEAFFEVRADVDLRNPIVGEEIRDVLLDIRVG